MTNAPDNWNAGVRAAAKAMKHTQTFFLRLVNLPPDDYKLMEQVEAQIDEALAALAPLLRPATEPRCTCLPLPEPASDDCPKHGEAPAR
jgi:hypothetical protein